jgi:hypothetical protein
MTLHEPADLACHGACSGNPDARVHLQVMQKSGEQPWEASVCFGRSPNSWRDNMQLGRLLCVLLSLLVLCSSSPAPCSDWKVPEPGEEVELLLKFGDVLRGTLIDLDSKHISIMREDQVTAEVRLPIAAVAGIRRPDESAFRTPAGELLPPDFRPEQSLPIAEVPRKITVKTYDKLPLMGVAIIGGVFAGDRFGKASAERDLGDSMQKLGFAAEAQKLYDSADDHETQAWIGVLIGGLGLLVACIPSEEEIPIDVTSGPDGDVSSVAVSLRLSSLFSRVRQLGRNEAAEMARSRQGRPSSN